MGEVTGTSSFGRFGRGTSSSRRLRGISASVLACALGVGLAGSAAASVRAPAAQRASGHDHGGGHGPGSGHEGHGSLWLEGVAGNVTATSGSSGSTGGTFTIAKGTVTFTVTYTSTTRIEERHGDATESSPSLQNGDLVVVQGSLTGTDAVTATSIRIVAGPGVPVVFSGTVSSIGSGSTTGGTSSCTTSPSSNETFTVSRGENGLVQITVTSTPTTTYELVGEPGFAIGAIGTAGVSSTSTDSSTSTAGSSATGNASFCDLAVGDRVVVRGSVTGADALTATSVEIRATGGTLAVGVITAITPPSSGSGTTTTGSFTLRRGGPRSLSQETVEVTSTTTYADLGPWPPVTSSSSSSGSTSGSTTTPGSLGFATLAVGDRVAVRGAESAPGTITASLVVLLPSSLHTIGDHPSGHGGHDH